MSNSGQVNKVRFGLYISAEDYLRYYSGSAKNVIVKADNGQNIQFPANALQAHVSQDGVEGRFELWMDQNNKLIKLVRIA